MVETNFHTSDVCWKLDLKQIGFQLDSLRMVNTADPTTWEAHMTDGEVLPFSLREGAALFFSYIPKEEIFISINQT